MDFESYSYNDEEFDLLLDDLSSEETPLDYTSNDDSSTQSTIPVIMPIKPKTTNKNKKNTSQTNNSLYQCKKRKIDVVVNNSVVSFEADFPRPRVVKTDIRRSYANMYVNAMNSADLPLLFGFFDTFCCPAFSHYITRTIPMTDETKSFSFSRFGIAECVMFWYYSFVTVPDSTVQLISTDVMTSDDGKHSKVVAKYVFKATKIFDCSPLWKKMIDNPSDACNHFFDLSMPKKNNNSNSNVMDSIVEAVNDKVSSLSLMEEPIPVESEGSFILYLDEDKRLTRMEMESRSLTSLKHCQQMHLRQQQRLQERQ